jgi:hypothetical protein
MNQLLTIRIRKVFFNLSLEPVDIKKVKDEYAMLVLNSYKNGESFDKISQILSIPRISIGNLLKLGYQIQDENVSQKNNDLQK